MADRSNLLTDSAAPTSAESKARTPRLLWANCYCLLDAASGAAMSVRTMLHQLKSSGYEVAILGCTNFDSERGVAGVGPQWDEIRSRVGKIVRLVDGSLAHNLMVTASTVRRAMTVGEHSIWDNHYRRLLDDFRPDIVFYYGGQSTDMTIALEARLRGIPVVFYLANGNYQATHWCRDIDLVLTDSAATATMYYERQGIRATPVGKFIEPARVLAPTHSRERVLFVNPRLEKGAGIMIQLAMQLEQRRPDILFEVVESRGSWRAALQRVSSAMGTPRESLANVVATQTTTNMGGPFSRARVLLAPSLWWESGGRVAAEAMLNGIPAIVTDRGGLPEMIGDAGIRLRLPADMHEAPYNRLLPHALLQALAAQVESLYDDGPRYRDLCERALAVGASRHAMDVSTKRLLTALQPWVDRRAGDQDPRPALRQWHRHGLDDGGAAPDAPSKAAGPGAQSQ